MKIYTIKDIAAFSGVGISTVSRVLNNRPDVSEETRRKVMDVVKTYNYTQNANAKHLKQRNTGLISIIVRGRRNSFLNDIAERIIAHGSATGYNFMLDFIDESADEFETARKHLTEKKILGVIFLGSNIVGRREEIAALHLPCVFATVDTSQLSLPGVSSVSVDNRLCAQQAIDHLLANGHHRIAVFGGLRDVDDSIGRRYQGVLQSFAAHGLPFDTSLYVECSFTMEKAYRTAIRFLDAGHAFTAIFAMSDIMAIGIIRALADRGLRAPDDVSVIGFDGIELARFIIPTLTTIEQPADTLARSSVDLILRLLADENDSENRVVESALRAGGSVKAIGQAIWRSRADNRKENKGANMQ